MTRMPGMWGGRSQNRLATEQKPQRYEFTLSPHTNLPVTKTTRGLLSKVTVLANYCASNDNCSLCANVSLAVPSK
jgi:hypothetical protein